MPLTLELRYSNLKHSMHIHIRNTYSANHTMVAVFAKAELKIDYHFISDSRLIESYISKSKALIMSKLANLCVLPVRLSCSLFRHGTDY